MELLGIEYLSCILTHRETQRFKETSKMPFPSPEQQSVIDHRGRPLVVVAGPGAGKTRTLIERMIALLREDPNREVSFVTFTRTSRRDTGTRIQSVLDASVLEDTEFVFPRTSTLHTYAKSLVHRYARRIGWSPDFSVLVEDKGETALVLDELMSDLGLRLDARLACRHIECFRSTSNWPVGFAATSSERIQILEHFEYLLRFYDTFDIEGLVVAACKILRDFGDVPPLYLQVDEYQDLNLSDQQLVQLAASHPQSQVVVVGDDAQSIYGFRHANYEGIRALWDSPDWDHVSFLDCHRLPAHIQRAARALVGSEGYLGRLNACQDDGRRVLTFQCTTAKVQMEVVGKIIADLKSTGQNQDGRPLSYKDFIVLCPGASFVNLIAAALGNLFGIPTRQQKRESIPDDYWRLLLVLRMLDSQDSLALRQWLPLSGLNEDEIIRIRREAMQRGDSLYSHCATLTDQRIRDIYDALSRLRSAGGDPISFHRLLAAFPNLSIHERTLSDMGLTIDGVNREPVAVGLAVRCIYERFGLLDLESESDLPEDDKVLVTTLHSAKGLESEYVFVAWMNAKYMPMPNRDVREERRVLYVALTRARRDVIVTFHEIFNPSRHRLLSDEAMSPFLQEVRDHLNIKRVRKSDVGSIRLC
jgi:DNA helicase-2/ATP-dependent DNA helicase PcrA